MFSQLKMKTRLILGFAFVALGSVALGIAALSAISQILEADEVTYSKVTRPMAELVDMSGSLQRARVNVRELLLAEREDQRAHGRQVLDEMFAILDKSASEFERTIIGDAVRQQLNETRADVQAYREATGRVEALASGGKMAEARALVDGEGRIAAHKAEASIEKLSELKLETARHNFEANAERASGARTTVVVVCAIAILGALAMGAFIARSIAEPLNRAAQIADSGDLSARVNLTSDDEIGRLAKAFDAMTERLETKAREAERIAKGDLTTEVEVASDQDALGKSFRNMVEQLRKLVSEVRGAFSEVTNGASEISDASQALSQGATEQASSVEEITSSMTEVGSQAKTSSENADQASHLASAARDAAQQGSERMKSMVEAMNDINGSSQQIAKIIKVIDDIAFQTNLLALNAAVEAARAGKHGKGFAVVAEEVRNLASRSAKAARETAELIEASGKKVANGLSVAQGTSESFASIVGNVVKAADLVGEIAAASKEQAGGIGQISQGLSQIDQVTQRNTASAEETASAAEELRSNAGHIEELFARFRVGDEGSGARAAARRPAGSGKKKPSSAAAPVKAPRTARAAPADGEWGGPGNRALAARPPALPGDGALEPKDVIALDDKEFGRF
jgi:methyl-accepting chemotaxis protein